MHDGVLLWMNEQRPAASARKILSAEDYGRALDYTIGYPASTR